MEYLVGTSGWDYDHWKGRFYPEDVPKRRRLEFYAREFATVEVNYSFYRWPSEKTLAGWRERTPEGFRFTLKAPRTITHLKKLRDVARLVKDFYKLTDILKEKAGCHLFQLPPSFRRDDDNVALLQKFVASLASGRDNAVEFRHKSWWDEEAYDLLRANGVAFCAVSGLGMPAEPVATADIAYFRFHGERYATRYPLKEIKAYGAAITGLSSRRVYAYFNNDAEAHAVVNAKELRTALEE
ncbi:MAG TPA: DUF72 domain-containing protein [bacterium]|nr:DUF72 domain-containing protein [bacterium]